MKERALISLAVDMFVLDQKRIFITDPDAFSLKDGETRDDCRIRWERQVDASGYELEARLVNAFEVVDRALHNGEYSNE